MAHGFYTENMCIDDETSRVNIDLTYFTNVRIIADHCRVPQNVNVRLLFHRSPSPHFLPCLILCHLLVKFLYGLSNSV
jgi:hypothetical protein